jgi:2-hydroxycyclohexanecarboxyl-CoA dehydrogenase
MEMKAKTVVVTGGGSGIGRATVLAFAAAGARVFVGDVDESGGNATCETARAKGLEVEYVRLDVNDAGSVDSFAARVGRADVVVNAAGWDRIQPFVENTPEFWDRVVGINMMGPIRLCRAFLPGMMDARSGKIVNVASDAGRVGSMGETVYAAAKGGVIAFTKSLARETARYSINVNCVCPGPTDTPLFHAQPEKLKDALTRAIPFRRIAKPEELADAVLFFGGPRSDYITGQVLSVSGGLTMVD